MDQTKKIVVTREGLTKLKKEYEELVNKKRPETVVRLAEARSQGDLSENSEYVAARQALSFIDGRIAELKQIIQGAFVARGYSKSKVNVGCRVTLHVKGKKEEFTIVGEWEADPTKKKISHSSPLGMALLGKKVGEEVEVEAPAGKIKYKIVSIG